MAECLYDGVRTGANTTSVAVSRLNHLAARVDSTNDTTHDGIDFFFVRSWEDGLLVLWK